jgi:DNA-directed RNA polymerase subunit RPC12/RpoP
MTDRKKKKIRKCHICGQLTGNADFDLETGEMVYVCPDCAGKKADKNYIDWP